MNTNHVVPRPFSQQGWQASPAPKWRHPLAVQGAGLVLVAALTALHGSWAAQVLLVPLLLVLPGVILLRALRVSGDAIAMYPVYVPSASLLVLTASGLVVDVVGPLTGISAPLRAAPLLLGLELVCVALLMSSVNAPPETDDTLEFAITACPAGLAASPSASRSGGSATAQQRPQRPRGRGRGYRCDRLAGRGLSVRALA